MVGFNPLVFLINLTYLKPELFLVAAGGLLLFAAVALPPGLKKHAGVVALVCLVVTAILVVSYLPGVPFGKVKQIADGGAGAFVDRDGHGAFMVDGFAIVFKLIFIVGAILTVLMSMRYRETAAGNSAEFHAMVLFSVLGMMFLASGTDLITIYIGLETMALAGYILVGFRKTERRSNEGALKYFLLGAFASGILLYGFSLVYGTTGSVNLAGISDAVAAGSVRSGMFLSIGAILVLVGMAFKISAVPFHMWAPDAYEGATTPATSFLATAAKTGAFAMILRVFLQGFDGLSTDWTLMLVLLSAASMTFGNIAALLQKNVKRMLAYSSIGHVGYTLMGLVVVGWASTTNEAVHTHGMTAITIYLLVYTFATAGAFSLVVMLHRQGEVGERVEDFAGLARTRPLAAASMLIFLLSLAGIPCTAGFIGKWWLFGAAILTGKYTWLAVVAVLNSVISLYYYARVIIEMYMSEPSQEARPVLPVGLGAAIGLAAIFTIVIGLYPQPFILLAQKALLPLGGL